MIETQPTPFRETPHAPGRQATPKELLMRYAPVALALSALVAMNGSALWSAAPVPLDPRAAALQAEGREALGQGDLDRATDAFEAGLAIQPGSAQLVMDLAETARRQNMQGKALHYYRAVLDRDPRNLAAIAGEGAALAEKGAVEKAKANLARLQGLCGENCPETQALTAALAKAATPQQVAGADKPAS